MTQKPRPVQSKPEDKLGNHRWLALSFIAALLYGRPVRPTFKNTNEAKTLDWGDDRRDDLLLIVEEGRRQMKDQTDRFRHTTDRGQVLLTVSLAALAFWVGTLSLVAKTDDWERVVAGGLWCCGGFGLIGGIAAAAGVVVVKATFSQIDTTQMTTWTEPVSQQLANEYADAVRIGEVTVADRVTVFRQATRLVVWGALLTAGAAAIAL